MTVYQIKLATFPRCSRSKCSVRCRQWPVLKRCVVGTSYAYRGGREDGPSAPDNGKAAQQCWRDVVCVVATDRRLCFQPRQHQAVLRHRAPVSQEAQLATAGAVAAGSSLRLGRGRNNADGSMRPSAPEQGVHSPSACCSAGGAAAQPTAQWQTLRRPALHHRARCQHTYAMTDRMCAGAMMQFLLPGNVNQNVTLDPHAAQTVLQHSLA